MNNLQEAMERVDKKLGGASTPNKPPVFETLEQAIDRVRDNDLAGLLARLYDLRDRIRGPMPSPVTDQFAAKEGGGAVDRIARKTTSIMELVKQCHSVLDDLNL